MQAFIGFIKSGKVCESQYSSTLETLHMEQYVHFGTMLQTLVKKFKVATLDMQCIMHVCKNAETCEPIYSYSPVGILKHWPHNITVLKSCYRP